MSNASEEQAAGREEVLAYGGWHLPVRKPGDDDLWDRLGDDWQAIDGVLPPGPRRARVYVRWEKTDDGRSQISGLCVAGDPGISATTVRAIPVGRLENLFPLPDYEAAQQDFFAKLPPLARDPAESPEQFSERVATYYRFFAAGSARPAKDIANHSHVPVATVRGWIREARLRGKLPPGKRGKAG